MNKIYSPFELDCNKNNYWSDFYKSIFPDGTKYEEIESINVALLGRNIILPEAFIKLLCTKENINCYSINCDLNPDDLKKLMDARIIDSILETYLHAVDVLIICEQKGLVIEPKIKLAFLTTILTHSVEKSPYGESIIEMFNLTESELETIRKRTILGNTELHQRLIEIDKDLPNNIVNFKNIDKNNLSILLTSPYSLFDVSKHYVNTFKTDKSAELYGISRNSSGLLYIIYELFSKIKVVNNKISINVNDKELKKYFIHSINIKKDPYELLIKKLLNKLGNMLVNTESKLEDSIFEDIKTKVGELIIIIKSLKENRENIDLNEYYKGFSNPTTCADLCWILTFLDDDEITELCLNILSSEPEIENYYNMNPSDEKNIIYIPTNESINVGKDNITTTNEPIFFGKKETNPLSEQNKAEIEIALNNMLTNIFFDLGFNSSEIEIETPNDFYEWIFSNLFAWGHSLCNKGEYLDSDLSKNSLLSLLVGSSDSKLNMCGKLLLFNKIDKINMILTPYEYNSTQEREIIIREIMIILASNYGPKNAGNILNNIIIYSDDSNFLYTIDPILIHSNYIDAEIKNKIFKTLYGIEKKKTLKKAH